MKKSLFILAVLSAFASVAHAQTVDNSGPGPSDGTNVTLYGIIDGGLDYVINSQSPGSKGNQLRFSDGVMQGSRFGLKGQEMIGNGTSAIFQLENGFNVMRGTLGQGGRMFGRQAYVGLSNTQLGTVTLGRQYDNAVDFVGPLNFGDQIGGSYSAHLVDIDNLNNSYRFNNAIKYQSPNYHGFQAGGMYSLGGWAGSITKNQAYSVGAGYANGPMQFGFGVVRARNPNSTLYGYNDNVYQTNLNLGSIANPGPDDVSNYGNYGNYGSARTYQAISVGGAYRLFGGQVGQALRQGQAQIGAVYSNTNFSDMTPTPVVGADPSNPIKTTGTGTARYNSVELNGTYQLMPQLAVGGAWNWTKAKNAFGIGASPTYNQFSLAADYALSHRTDVYAQGVYQRAKDGFAQINMLSPSTSKNQGVIRIGLRHKF